MSLIPPSFWRYIRSGPALNLWAGYFCFGSTALYGILSLPLAVRFLDKEELGLWNLVTQVVGYLLWLDLGVTAMTGRTLAEPMHGGKQVEIDRTWSSILVILSCQAGLILAAGFSGLPFFLSYFQIPATLQGDAAFVFGGTVLVSAISLPLRAIPGVFLCQDRLHWSLVVQGTMPWINLLIFWLMLSLGYGVRSFVFSTAFVNLCQFLWFRRLLSSGGQPLRFRPRLVSGKAVRPILGFSSSMMLWSIAPAAIGSIPAVVAGRKLGLDQVSIYQVTSRVPVMLASVTLRTYHSFYPRIQRYFVAGEHERFVSLFRLSTWLSVWASGVVLAIAFAVNSMVVGLLARPDFFGGHLLTLLVATALLVVAMNDHLGSLFYCAGKAKLLSPVLALEILLTFAAASWLCTAFGLEGVAVAIACLPLVIRLPYFVLNGPKICGTSFRELYSPGFSGIVAWTLCGWGAWMLSSGDVSWYVPSIGAAAAVAGLGFAAVSLRLGWREWHRCRIP